MTEYAVLVFSLIMVACFSAAETSFVVSDKVALLVGQGKGYSAKSAVFFLQNDNIFFASVVVAANLFITIFSSLSEGVFHEQLHLGLSAVILLTTSAGLLLGELIPKTAAMGSAEPAAGYLLPLVKVFYSIFRPVVDSTARVSSFIAEHIFKSPPHSAIFQKRDVYRFLGKTVSSGYLDKIESEMIRKFLSNANLPVRTIAVPRTQIVAVKLGTRIEKLRDIFEKTGKSKVAVYDSTIDNIVGVVHAKELFKNAASISELVNDVLFVPENISVVDLLDEFRSERVYVAVLIDEFGGTTGFVTTSDVMELFLGEVAIMSNEQKILETGRKQYLISGGAEVAEVETRLRIKLPKGDYTTVAGMVLSELGRIPAQGERVYIHGFEFLVVKSDGKKVDSLRLTLK
ncbi:MAG TPA: hemolysin family protein [Candidatus Kryptonia bacterium]